MAPILPESGLPDWMKGIHGNVIVTDTLGVILYLNDGAAAAYAAAGGRGLLGSNMLDCHPPDVRTQVAAMLAEGRANSYTITRGGQRRLVHQSPWYDEGRYAGFVELVLPLPEGMPHFDRDAGA
jgi:hypothetical protein